MKYCVSSAAIGSCVLFLTLSCCHCRMN